MRIQKCVLELHIWQFCKYVSYKFIEFDVYFSYQIFIDCNKNFALIHPNEKDTGPLEIFMVIVVFFFIQNIYKSASNRHRKVLWKSNQNNMKNSKVKHKYTIPFKIMIDGNFQYNRKRQLFWKYFQWKAHIQLYKGSNFQKQFSLQLWKLLVVHFCE